MLVWNIVSVNVWIYNKCIIMSIGRDLHDTLFVKFDEFKLVFMCICFDRYLIGKFKGV